MSEEKCVIIINNQDAPGIAANAIACLSFGLGAIFPEAKVEPRPDRDNIQHGGIINKPILILSASADILKDIFLKAKQLDTLHVLDMNNRAQEARTLAEYEALLAQTSSDEFNYSGIALYGSRRDINKLTGSLKLFS